MLWSSCLTAQLGCCDGRHRHQLLAPHWYLSPTELSQDKEGGGSDTAAAAAAVAADATIGMMPCSVGHDLGNLFEWLSQSLNIPTELLMTAKQYVAVDSQLQTCECMANSDILAMVTSQSGQ